MLKRSLAATVATLAVVIALLASASPTSASPASAARHLRVVSAPGAGPSARVAPDVRRVGQAPAWVRTDRAAVDWKWFKGGWEVRFSKRETVAIAGYAGLCSGTLGLISHPALKVLSLGCALLSWYAAKLVSQGRCLNAFVPFRLTGGFSVGSRAC